VASTRSRALAAISARAASPRLPVSSPGRVISASSATRWNKYRNVGLVVGATQPGELKRIRELVGPMTLLLPGIGAQGGEVGATVEAGAGGGMILSASRSILYASSEPDFAECARAVAEATRNEINARHA